MYHRLFHQQNSICEFVYLYEILHNSSKENRSTLMMESLTNLMYVGDSIDISIQYILI
jgi:hypothetical protein